VEVIDFTRKHTARVGDAHGEIRRHVEALVAKRNERRDGFANVIKKAMREKLGADTEEVMKALVKNGLRRGFVKQALEQFPGGITQARKLLIEKPATAGFVDPDYKPGPCSSRVLNFLAGVMESSS
jgi:hypothetical protein